MLQTKLTLNLLQTSQPKYTREGSARTDFSATDSAPISTLHAVWLVSVISFVSLNSNCKHLLYGRHYPKYLNLSPSCYVGWTSPQITYHALYPRLRVNRFHTGDTCNPKESSGSLGRHICHQVQEEYLHHSEQLVELNPWCLLSFLTHETLIR